MRTLIAIASGTAISIVVVFVSKSLGRGTVTGAIVFIALWLAFCAFDFANGVKAGYSALDELGIHIVVFVVPAFAAWLAARMLS